jgi:hypothetical protein
MVDAFNQRADQSASFANRQVIPQRLQVSDRLEDSHAVWRTGFNSCDLFINVQTTLLIASKLIAERGKRIEPKRLAG